MLKKREKEREMKKKSIESRKIKRKQKCTCFFFLFQLFRTYIINNIASRFFHFFFLLFFIYLYLRAKCSDSLFLFYFSVKENRKNCMQTNGHSEMMNLKAVERLVWQKSSNRQLLHSKEWFVR